MVVLYGLTRGNWLQGFLAGITLAMAMLPEEFPVVLTIFLALGAWRLSKMNVLARRVPVIETLGSATVLCVDKTGTLTVNRMSIRKLAVDGTVHDVEQQGAQPLPEEFHEIVEFGILASQRDPFDPMEKAFHDLGNARLAETEHLHADWTLERGYALSPSLLAMSHVWKSPTGQDYVLATKGAPEAIADLCHLNAERTKAIGEQVAAMAQDGLRVLGVAKGVFEQQAIAGRAARLHLRVPGPRGFGRSGTSNRPRCRRGMLHGGHPSRHDYRRSPNHGQEHRSAGGHQTSGRDHHRPRTGEV